VTQPLCGIRVLDLSRVAAGPLATMLMADLGAEIIKIERLGTGDDLRAMGRQMPGAAPLTTDYFVGLNRSKHSLAIDISRPEGQSVAAHLACHCDVAVENFRPGVAARLGLGFEHLRKLRRGLVYTSISGFGSTGPMSHLPANDIMMQSLSGLMSVTGEPDGAPLRLGSSVSDFSTGLFALAGTMAALLVRDEHPRGQQVELSMLDASIALLPNLVPTASQGVRPRRSGRSHPQIMGYGTFGCSDGAFITVGAFSQLFWTRLCRVVGHEEWIDDPRFVSNDTRIEHREYLDIELDAAFATRSRDQWAKLLAEVDVPCAPVMEFDETLKMEQVAHNGAVWELADEHRRYKVAANPIRSRAWGAPEPFAPESIGQSTRATLTSLLGMSASEIDSLHDDGVIDAPSADKVARDSSATR
jgi:crotonobetainyl-CoA:carnitine CoA-transferase CaiB-like acyl-CoA transferase